MPVSTRSRSRAEATRTDRGDLQPTYAGCFRCIGAECEDPCCGEWDIPIDRDIFRAYQLFPAEKLGSTVAQFVSENPGNPHPNLHASIHRTREGACPFFGADHLCAIQKEYGPKLLSATCSLYPRSLAVVDGTLEGSLSLSCPEAARAILLKAGAMQQHSDLRSGGFRTDNVFRVRPHAGLDAFFLPVRGLVTRLLSDRSQPLWQRLLLVASFCIRLNEIAAEDWQAIEPLFARYRRAVGLGPSSALDELPASIASRLDLTIAMSNKRCTSADTGKRFRDVFWEFIEGIGSADSGDSGEDIRRFSEANERYLAPFLDARPFLAENLLLNYVYQHLFPFGRAGSDRFISRSIADEAVLLIAQFSWLVTLLTGVAAHRGESFSEADAVTTVQAFMRAVEHVPQASEDLLNHVRSRGLDDLPGLAKLLRS